MKLKKILQGILASYMISSSVLCVFAPSNTFPPYDPNVRLPKCPNMRIHLGATAEYGQSNSARDCGGDKHNVLSIYDEFQDAAAMFKNPSANIKDAVTTEYNNMYAAFGGQLVTAPISFEGEYRELDLTLFGKYTIKNFIDGDLDLSVHLPVRWRKIENIQFKDLSKDFLPMVPYYYQQNYTKNFDVFNAKMKELGNIDFGECDKSGIGDLVIMLEWLRSFKQNKEALKNVDIFVRLGLSCPTAENRDLDKVFSLSLGNDGAWGMPIGFGLGLDFSNKIRAGGDVDFFILFDETKERRLKTSSDQTEFLLLNKGRATLDSGLTWKFNIFLQAYRFYKGLSLKMDYEYIKHDDDTLYEKTDTFDRTIINSANSLKEWNTHNLIFQVNFDFFMWQSVLTRPQLSLFYKYPIAGKNIINMDTFGGQLGFNF